MHLVQVLWTGLYPVSPLLSCPWTGLLLLSRALQSLISSLLPPLSVWVLYYDRRSVGQSIFGFASLLMWCALSDERTGLSFTVAAGPRQRSHSRTRVPGDSRQYFTVSDSRLPFLSLPTTRRATVEVFDPASTRDCLCLVNSFDLSWLHADRV
jgi:hypothetical protein